MIITSSCYTKSWIQYNLQRITYLHAWRYAIQFLQYVIFGDTVSSNHTGIHPHKDDKDVIFCIITLSAISEGGATVYYKGLKEKQPGDKDISIPFEHGRIQFGSFSKVVHGVDKWVGNKITLNFNIKEQNFRTFGDRYYKQWVESNYEKKTFFG